MESAQDPGAQRQPRRVILLDYDGVLADSKELAGRIFIRALNQIGYGGITSTEEVVALCDGNAAISLQEAGLSMEEIDEAYRQYSRFMREDTEKAPLFPGVKATILQLYADSYLHIVTSSSHAVVQDTLHNNDIDFVDGIWGIDDEPSKVKKIQHLLRLYPELPAYFLGDTRGDMIESREAGVVAIAATWGWHDRQRLARGNPDHYLDDIRELPALLAKLTEESD